MGFCVNYKMDINLLEYPDYRCSDMDLTFKKLTHTHKKITPHKKSLLSLPCKVKIKKCVLFHEPEYVTFHKFVNISEIHKN